RVIELRGRVSIAVLLARIAHEPNGRIGAQLDVPIERERLARIDARIRVAAEDEQRRARLSRVIDGASLERELPVVPRPRAPMHLMELVRDVARAGGGNEVR